MKIKEIKMQLFEDETVLKERVETNLNQEVLACANVVLDCGVKINGIYVLRNNDTKGIIIHYPDTIVGKAVSFEHSEEKRKISDLVYRKYDNLSRPYRLEYPSELGLQTLKYRTYEECAENAMSLIEDGKSVNIQKKEVK